MSAESRLQRQTIAVAQLLERKRLAVGTAGNVSARVAGGFLVTPSGFDYEALRPEHLVRVTFGEEPRPKRVGPITLKASSEWRFHHDIYVEHPEARAIVHAHPPFATALACMGKNIPAFHYMVAVAGGIDIPCARYATFGTQQLSDAILAVLKDRRACLMAQHGMLAFASEPMAALALAVEVEALAEQYIRVLQIGRPRIISRAEMGRVLDKFKTYGSGQR